MLYSEAQAGNAVLVAIVRGIPDRGGLSHRAAEVGTSALNVIEEGSGVAFCLGPQSSELRGVGAACSATGIAVTGENGPRLQRRSALSSRPHYAPQPPPSSMMPACFFMIGARRARH